MFREHGSLYTHRDEVSQRILIEEDLRRQGLRIEEGRGIREPRFLSWNEVTNDWAA